jgi:hypothetical protein
MNQATQQIIARSWIVPSHIPQRGGRVQPLIVQASLQALIRVGHAFGSLGAYPPAAGAPQGARRIQIANTAAVTLTGCKARLINRVKRFKRTGEVFARVRPFAEFAIEKLTGSQVAPYALSVSGVSGSGAAKTMTLAGASLTSVKNLTTLVVGGLVGLNVVDYYRAMDGDLESMEFKLSEAAVNSDFENLLVFSNRFAQIAADVAGTAGTFGVAPVALTEAGQPAGSIRAAGLAYCWVRVLVPDSGNSESNPYPIDVCLEASVSAGAGVTS